MKRGGCETKQIRRNLCGGEQGWVNTQVQYLYEVEKTDGPRIGVYQPITPVLIMDYKLP